MWHDLLGRSHLLLAAPCGLQGLTTPEQRSVEHPGMACLQPKDEAARHELCTDAQHAVVSVPASVVSSGLLAALPKASAARSDGSGHTQTVRFTLGSHAFRVNAGRWQGHEPHAHAMVCRQCAKTTSLMMRSTLSSSALGLHASEGDGQLSCQRLWGMACRHPMLQRDQPAVLCFVLRLYLSSLRVSP